MRVGRGGEDTDLRQLNAAANEPLRPAYSRITVHCIYIYIYTMYNALHFNSVPNCSARCNSGRCNITQLSNYNKLCDIDPLDNRPVHVGFVALGEAFLT
jgi:hypothetical protein